MNKLNKILQWRFQLTFAALLFVCMGFYSYSREVRANEANDLQPTVIESASAFGDKGPATRVLEDGRHEINPRAPIFGGQIVDATKFVPIRILEAQGYPGDQGSTITIKNYHHAGKLYTAVVPVGAESIEQTLVQLMPLPIVQGILAGHVQIRFKMAPQVVVKLIDPVSGEETSTKDVVISYEAAYPPGASYNFALGAIDANPLIASIGSGERSVAVSSGRSIRQFKVPIEGQWAAKLLDYFLRDADRIQMFEFYNTISPNCTTTVFDGIDQILALKGQQVSQPFKTVIGGDPVIGPSINALLDRFQDQVIEVQRMDEEIQKGVRAVLGVPERTDPQPLPFAAQIDGMPMTLVIDRGQFRGQGPRQQQMDAVIQRVITELPSVMTNLLEAAQAFQFDPQMAGVLLKRANGLLSERLRSLNLAQVGEGALHIFFAPLAEVAGSTRDLTQFGVRAALEFPLLVSDQVDRALLQQGLDQAASSLVAGLPAQLNALAINLAFGEEPTVESQVFMSVAQQAHSLELEPNPKVQIDQFVIEQPSVGVLYSQKRYVQGDRDNPFAVIQFGPQVIADTDNQSLLVMSRFSMGPVSCFWNGERPQVPVLRGKAGSPLDGVKGFFLNWLLRFGHTDLSITEVQIDISSLEVKSTRVLVGVLSGAVRCIEQEDVSNELTEAINQAIREQMKRFEGLRALRSLD